MSAASLIARAVPATSECTERRLVLGAIAIAHVALVVVLARSGAIAPERLPQVLRISLLTAEPPRPAPAPPRKPPANPPQHVTPPAVLAAPAAVPTAAAAAVVAMVVAPVAEPAPIAPPEAPPVTPPRFDAEYLDNPKPVYPPASRRLSEEGKVVLNVFVEATGTPGMIAVHRSSGSPRLDAAALAAVARWRFTPARQGSLAVGAWVLVPITFKLDF